MSQPSHQVVELSTGTHRSSEDGVCVTELASMLAGEPFTDRPVSVCPVIAAFLRTYNDVVDDRRRRDLYRFASASVGTRGSQALQERRAELCRRWICERHPQVAGRPARLVPSRWRAWGMKDHQHAGMVAGRLATQNVRRDRAGAHEAALALVEQLIACGRGSGSESHSPSTPLPTAAARTATGGCLAAVSAD